MGSVRRAPRTNRWEARYRDPAGRQRTATFDRKGDAQAFLATTEADRRRGAWRSPEAGRLTFADVATAWLDSNPAKRPTTLAGIPRSYGSTCCPCLVRCGSISCGPAT